MSHTRSFAFIAIAGSLAGACTGDDNVSENRDLTVEGVQFPAGSAHVNVTQTAIGETVACVDTVVDAGGSFKLELGKILQPKVGHRLDVFVDVNGDDRCEFGVDAVETSELPPSTIGTHQTFNGVDSIGRSPTGCAGFGGVSFELILSGVSRNLVKYALVRMTADGGTPEKIITVGNVISEGGRATIDLVGVGQPGHFYQIDFFEANDVAVCDAENIVWRWRTGAAGVDAPSACEPLIGGGFQMMADLASPTPALQSGACSSFAK